MQKHGLSTALVPKIASQKLLLEEPLLQPITLASTDFHKGRADTGELRRFIQAFIKPRKKKKEVKGVRGDKTTCRISCLTSKRKGEQ